MDKLQVAALLGVLVLLVVLVAKVDALVVGEAPEDHGPLPPHVRSDVKFMLLGKLQETSSSVVATNHESADKASLRQWARPVAFALLVNL